jgi:hypothetical protein
MPGTEVRTARPVSHEGLLQGPAVFLDYADASTTGHSDGWFGTGGAVELHAGR